MRTPVAMVTVAPRCFAVHPRGEMHEHINGPRRTLLFRVRYGGSMATRIAAWRGKPAWAAQPEDTEYFRRHPLRE
jgi:hypothetical protein